MSEIRDSLTITAGFVGTVVGAGFSSGQEILQFFTNFGVAGIAGAVLCTALLILLSHEVCISGFHLKSTSYRDMTRFFCGNTLGWIADILIALTLFSVFAVMIAGGNSLLNQYLELPSPYGGALIMLLTLALAGLSVRHLIIAVGLSVPLLLVITVIIWVYALQQQSIGYASLEAFAQIQTNRSASHWLISAVLYVSYNLGTAAPFLVLMGGQAATRRTAALGSVLGGLLLGALILLMDTAMFAQLGAVAVYPMPMLALAQSISPAVGALMALVIFSMILSTALACLYPLLTRLAPPATHRFRLFAGAASVLGLIAGSTGFVPLLSITYPLVGALGMLLIVSIFVKWVKARLDQLR